MFISRCLFGLSLATVGAFAACDPQGAGPSDRDNDNQGEVADPPPLASVHVPEPQGGDIVDRDAAIRLGKALFWDVQTGGDGQTACASCHFAAGADSRRVNTVSPGANGLFNVVTGPNAMWNGKSFGETKDDVVGSQGVVGTRFTSIDPDPAVAADVCTPDQTSPFGASRRVTGRNAPSVVAAVFFRDNFWDGRANHRFNGLNPFGATGNAGGVGSVDIENASLASQASGPPNNPVEMSCDGRPFNGPDSLASKMLARTPLGQQTVAPDDSVLGTLSASPAPGLNCGAEACTYVDLIEDAFGPALAADAEANFSRIWGQAIAAYEATLIPDDTPFDRFLAGDVSAMTQRQRDGWTAFKDSGCADCHAGSELSDATVAFAEANGLINADGGDQGFHNIGVRPTAEDLGRAGTGPEGVSWSLSGSSSDRGAFKTPALRNVALTAPFMHTGGIATLRDVVLFYKDRGFFANAELAGDMESTQVDGGDVDALVDFMTNALTDCRTAKERAPFDHPSLPLPNGTALPAIGAGGKGSCP